MDEQAYKSTFHEINQFPCPFGKAMLSSRCACEKFQKLNLAEREAAACISPQAHALCEYLLELLYLKTRFALGIVDLDEPIPHAKAMRTQCGSILGLRELLKIKRSEQYEVDNIYGLIQSAIEAYESLDKLPFSEIVTYVRQYKVRRKK
ncbi:hypothetical protein [Candidatus Albibeggiatoa sp. nov. BB20]|uniref:hypothetical protein n=1 Tax=Candidatus Albibeggiatoa sp. nov. BB20 TaxID=3162723 RepID=UPI0033656C56